MTFKVGDVVECVSAAMILGLIAGNKYTVSAIIGDKISVKEHNGYVYYSTRFKLVDETKWIPVEKRRLP